MKGSDENKEVTYEDIQMVESTLDEGYIKLASAENFAQRIMFALACEDLRKCLTILKKRYYEQTNKRNW
jgi:hypothetical protein